MDKRKTDIWDIIVNTIIIAVFIIIVYWFFELLFGGSPTISEFNFGLVVLLAGGFAKVYREVGEIKVGMKYSFGKIREDMDLIKKRLKV